jgi:sugar phosphate permease
MRDFGLGDAAMGDFWFAFLIAYGLFQVPWGLLGDRLGTRHLLGGLVLGWSLTMAALALVPAMPGAARETLILLLCLRFLFGAFQAGAFPPLSRIVADWMPVGNRGSAQGAIWTFSRLGGAGIPMLLVPLFAFFGGWRTPFLLLAGLGALWAVAFWLWFRNYPSEMRQVNDAERDLIAAGRAPASLKRGGVPWVRMLRSPSVWGLFLTYGCGGFAGHFFTSLLPVYLEKHRGLGADTAKVLAGLPLACGIAGCFLGGFLSDRLIAYTGNRKWGRRLVPCLAFALGGLCWVAIPRIEPLGLFGLVLCLTFFCNDLCMAPAWASCADVGEAHAGTLSGGMNAVGALCGAVGASLAGRLMGAGRYDLLFLIYGGCFGLASLSWLLVDVTRPLSGAAAE